MELSVAGGVEWVISMRLLNAWLCPADHGTHVPHEVAGVVAQLGPATSCRCGWPLRGCCCRCRCCVRNGRPHLPGSRSPRASAFHPAAVLPQQALFLLLSPSVMQPLTTLRILDVHGIEAAAEPEAAAVAAAGQ